MKAVDFPDGSFGQVFHLRSIAGFCGLFRTRLLGSDDSAVGSDSPFVGIRGRESAAHESAFPRWVLSIQVLVPGLSEGRHAPRAWCIHVVGYRGRMAREELEQGSDLRTRGQPLLGLRAPDWQFRS